MQEPAAILAPQNRTQGRCDTLEIAMEATYGDWIQHMLPASTAGGMSQLEMCLTSDSTVMLMWSRGSCVRTLPASSSKF